jgi:hypothetical protein
LTILFAFAVDGVAKFIENLFDLAWISFSGLVSQVHLMRGPVELPVLGILVDIDATPSSESSQSKIARFTVTSKLPRFFEHFPGLKVAGHN